VPGWLLIEAASGMAERKEGIVAEFRVPRASVLVQALLKKGDAIPKEHLRFVCLVGAFELLELFCSSFFRRGAILWGNLVGVDQPLRNTGLTE
jgi:hypothetical protein